MFLKKSTAVNILVGPFIDETDGITPLTALSLSSSDFYFFKSGASSEVNNITISNFTHCNRGRYYLTIPSNAVDTEGPLEITIHPSGSLPVKYKATVIPADIYTSLITAATYLKTNIKQITDSDNYATWLGEATQNNGDISYINCNVSLWDSSQAPVSFLSNDGISNIISADFSSCVFPQMQSSIVANGINVNSISSFSFTAAKFGSGAITSTVLADGAITTAKIADGSITDAKITVPTVSAGIATGILGMVQQLWRRFFKKVVNDKSNLTIKTYANDGTTVLTTQTYSNTVTTEQVGDAS